MGEACARHLTKKQPRTILVANRSVDRAEELARALGGRAILFGELEHALVEADIVISSTSSPDVLLDCRMIEQVMRVRGHRPLCLIDLAVPRNVDPAAQSLPNVYLYNIDELKLVAEEHVRLRKQELAHCQSIITEHTAALLRQLASAQNRVPVSHSSPSGRWTWTASPAFAQ